MTGRQLLAECMSAPAILNSIADDDDLRDAGLNSGEMVLLVMKLEDEIGRAMEDEEIVSVATIADIDALLGARPAQDTAAVCA
ncbi:phosphopantetheine-binding protein [Streptomyces sp. cmx-4-9]|uniref:phosphopantetheine-binding protein n=1 Tax=Streptomyces sp. cmx-4-9 TaxID=2790941 RepID=UPI00397FD770